MKVPAEKLRSVLGLTNVYYTENQHSLAITDSPLLDTDPTKNQ
jgi:Icc protein